MYSTTTKTENRSTNFVFKSFGNLIKDLGDESMNIIK